MILDGRMEGIMRRGGRGSGRSSGRGGSRGGRRHVAKKQTPRQTVIFRGTAIDRDGNERRLVVYDNYGEAGLIYIQPNKSAKGHLLASTQQRDEDGIRREIEMVYGFTKIKLAPLD